jgi:glycosyltransferase involved in cell wall biosynthesis
MRCPALDELPPPPVGKTGWPWTEETILPQRATGEERTLPRITIITPSYNQGIFLEETLRSVLLQGYPDLEYVVVDGGSTDDSVSIIRKYEQWLTHWVSEKDRGQADALCKGLRLATGEIGGWLNSDDLYMPGALYRVAQKFTEAPLPDVVFGNLYLADEHSRILDEFRKTRFLRLGFLYGVFFIHQPASFWRVDTLRQIGGIDPEFTFEMDTDLLFRFVRAKARFKFVREFLAIFRLHPSSKTSTILNVSDREMHQLRKAHLPFAYESVIGGLIRSMARIQRSLWYVVQGDLGWMMRRIPKRLRFYAGLGNSPTGR